MLLPLGYLNDDSNWWTTSPVNFHSLLHVRRILFPARQTNRSSDRTYIHQYSHLQAEEIGIDNLHKQLFVGGEGKDC